MIRPPGPGALKRLVIALSFGIVAAGSPGSPPASADLVIDFLGDYKGALDRCGCASGQYGGVARRATYLRYVARESAEEHRLKVCGGDFFPPGGSEERSKGRTVLKAIRAMNYDAIALGEYDFAFGLEPVLTETKGLPVVATNMEWAGSHESIGLPMILKTYQGIPTAGERHAAIKVAVLSFMDEDFQGALDRSLERDARKVHIVPAGDAAREWIPRARARAGVVVGLLHMSFSKASRFAFSNPGMDIVVCSHSDSQVVDPPIKVGGTWVVSNVDQGRWIGELRLTCDKDGRAVDAVGRQIALDETVDDDPAVASLVAGFKDQLARERGETSLREGAPGGAPGFATVQVCANCHKQAVEVWRSSAHARAYDTLVKSRDQAREECLKCHVLGLGQPGGFDANSPQPIYMEVQCESCHGPAVKHVTASPAERRSGVVARPGEAVCRQCHTSKRDPKFDFATRWERIRH